MALKKIKQNGQEVGTLYTPALTKQKKVLTKQHKPVKLSIGEKFRELTKKEALAMRTKIKNTINQTPKWGSLAIMAAGLIYAGFDLSHNETVIKFGIVVLTALLVEKAK